MEKQINSDCKCIKKCERHGKCDECEKHHLKLKSPVWCKRDVNKK